MDSNENVPPASPTPPPPPLIVPPAQMPRPKRSRGWMIAALILFAMLGFSVLLNFTQLVTGLGGSVNTMNARTSGPKLEEMIVEDHDSANKIAVIDIDGIITSGTSDQGFGLVELIRAQLDRAAEDSKVKAVLLRMDSPGGEVLASDEIYRALVQFQEDSGKPVITSMGNLAASGGYYISAASRWIVANELTITGSIGVIMHSWNYRGLMDKVGLRPMVFKSGQFKDMLSGERDPNDIPEEERKMVQSLIDETYSRFKDVVEEGREYAHEENKDKGKALANDWAKYADGRVLSGTQAYDLGFVDELGNFDTAVESAKDIAGIKAANLVRYQPRYDLSELFRIFGKSEARVIKVDLGMETPKIQAGRLYFLAPTFLH